MWLSQDHIARCYQSKDLDRCLWILFIIPYCLSFQVNDGYAEWCTKNLLSPKVIIFDSWSVYYRFRFLEQSLETIQTFCSKVTSALSTFKKRKKNFLYLSLTSYIQISEKLIHSEKKKSLNIYYVPDDSSRLWGIAVNKIFSWTHFVGIYVPTMETTNK